MNSDLCKPVTVDETFATDPRAWLARCMSADMPWLLAHADDGVIWGKQLDDGTLKLSSDVFSDPHEYPSLAVSLRAETLQQVRLFGKGGELLLWRTDKGFAARQIDDSPTVPPEAFEQNHLLWGKGVKEKDGFSCLIEGRRGFVHALPVDGLLANGRVALIVRHYLDYDDQDQAYVCLSRLVDLIRR